MKTKSVLMSMLMVFTFTLVKAQIASSDLKTPLAQLEADGTVLDKSGRPLGWITNDKIYDRTGTMLGIISFSGAVAKADGKEIIGVLQKDGSFKSKQGYIVTTDENGIIKADDKVIGRVSAAYKTKEHGFILQCFFNLGTNNTNETNNTIY